MPCDINPAVHEKIQEILKKHREAKGLEADLNALVDQMHDLRHQEEQAAQVETVEQAEEVMAASRGHKGRERERDAKLRSLLGQ